MKMKEINNETTLNEKDDSIIIRLKTDNDKFKDIAKVYAESWQYAYKDILPDRYLKKLTDYKWTKNIKNKAFTHIVAIDGGKIIGTSAVRLDNGEVVAIYLLPHYIGKGIGLKLMQKAVHLLKENGCSKITLWIFENNTRAKFFYEKFNFKFSGNATLTKLSGKSIVKEEYILEE